MSALPQGFAMNDDEIDPSDVGRLPVTMLSRPTSIRRNLRGEREAVFFVEPREAPSHIGVVNSVYLNVGVDGKTFDGGKRARNVRHDVATDACICLATGAVIPEAQILGYSKLPNDTFGTIVTVSEVVARKRAAKPPHDWGGTVDGEAA